jgi:hypothetical protein
MKRWLENIVEVLDNFILNNDITEWDLTYLRNYIKRATSNLYDIDVDWILSDFLIYVKEHYESVENDMWKKCKRVKQSIFWLIQNEMKNKDTYFDDYEDMYLVENNDVNDMKWNINMIYLDKLLKTCLSSIEFDIYRSCLLWNETQKTVADRRWVSSEWVSKKIRIVKDKVKKTLDF